MISERTLKKWRREALVGKQTYNKMAEKSYIEKRTTILPGPSFEEHMTVLERILRMSQEMLDQHLLRRPTR